MLNGHNPDRARDALYSIPADCDRPTWVKIGMAFHAAGGSRDDWEAWSAQADSYNAQACRATWRSFKTAPGGVGAGTLFGMARDSGWTDGNTTHKPVKPTPKPVEPPRKPAPGMSAWEVYTRCEAATNAHPYIAAKRASGVSLEALRVVPDKDPLRIMGESMVGALVVPCMAMDGTLSTLQLIPPSDVVARLKANGKPSKLNLPGHHLQGWFTVGNITPGGVVYIVEGVSHAWACWQATGNAAVVCFGVGNMGKVATALRQNDDTAVLVLVPDTGKESYAAKIAADVGGMVAAMPEGEASNFDANDLAQRDGFDVLELLLENATEPPRLPPFPKSELHQSCVKSVGAETAVHPLSRFVEFNGTAKPPSWVIPGFIGKGVVVIAGAHGVGKTTAVLPLAMTAAGLHGDALMPVQWRHIVYITEDIEQVERILAGIVNHSNLGINLKLVRERLHLVKAVRLDPAYVAQVGKTYKENFTRVVNDVEVLPLVVIDTKSAVMALENENDNSEASAMMAVLKQDFGEIPIWLMGHVAKSSFNRADVADLSSRGAGSVDGDGNQTIFLVREGESRYLVLGKTRFEPRWSELQITSYTAQAQAQDEFGNMETMVMRWGIAAPAEMTRKEASIQAKEVAQLNDAVTLRQDVRDAVDTAMRQGNPLNRSGVKAKVKRKASDVVAMIENLLNERWLYEVPVPAKVRAHSSRSSFLVNLSTEEHETFVRDGVAPESKMVIPVSWRKPEIPPVPAPENENNNLDGVEAEDFDIPPVPDPPVP